MANILLNIGKGIEVAAEDALKFIAEEPKVAAATPGAIAALGVLAGAVDKAVTATAAAAANPASIIVTLPTDLADFKAVWPATKSFLATLGIKV